jgi:hypothetical protein
VAALERALTPNIGNPWILWTLLNLLINVGVLAILFSLHFVLFSYLLKRYRRFVLPVLGVLLIVYGFLVPHLVTTFSTNQANGQEITRGNNEPFSLYKPGYTLPQYNLLSSGLTTGQDGQADYYDVSYVYANNDPSGPAPYDIYEFSAPSTYAPPRDCGDKLPLFSPSDHVVTPCQAIGQSTLGCIVYYATPSWTNEISAYCRIRKTMLVLYTTRGSLLSQTDALQVVNSLVPSNAAELQKLNPKQ